MPYILSYLLHGNLLNSLPSYLCYLLPNYFLWRETCSNVFFPSEKRFRYFLWRMLKFGGKLRQLCFSSLKCVLFWRNFFIFLIFYFKDAWTIECFCSVNFVRWFSLVANFRHFVKKNILEKLGQTCIFSAKSC